MITRQQALDFLNETIENKNIIKHMIAAEAMMHALAGKLKIKNEKFKIDEDEWGIVGLLHDGDYLPDVPPEKQGIEVTKMLRSKGYEVPDNVAYAMAAHNWHNTGVEPKSKMDWAIFCGDSLTGLIVAATLVLPSRRLADLTVENVLNRFGESHFAKGTRREDIAMCEEKLGIPLPEFVKITLEAMKGISKEFMVNIKLIRENPEKVKENLKKRGFGELALVDEALVLDDKRKKLLVEIEKLQAERNRIAKEGESSEEGRKIKEELKIKEPELSQVEDEYKQTLYKIPNLPHDDVPAGPEENKRLIRKVGEPRKFDFAPKDHLDLGVSLGIIDVARASKVSGSRFTYLKGQAVLLEFALVNFAFEKLIKEGFVPVLPPMLIKKEITDKLGYWHGRIDEQHTANENYYLVYDPKEESGEKDESSLLYLIGTAEHALVAMHAGEILSEAELPKKYVGFSSCFRREAGSYGKDVRGILRVHQFDKVEMVALVRPEEEKEQHEKMLSYAENLMKELELPYQVVILAAGDIGFPTAKTYDIETWLPGQDKYRETHSISTTTDYQARRLNIKYKENGKTDYVYILNGTAFAIGRTIIAILENYQQEDGSVLIPKALQKYIGFDRISPKK